MCVYYQVYNIGFFSSLYYSYCISFLINIPFSHSSVYHLRLIPHYPQQHYAACVTKDGSASASFTILASCLTKDVTVSTWPSHQYFTSFYTHHPHTFAHVEAYAQGTSSDMQVSNTPYLYFPLAFWCQHLRFTPHF
uniref:Uncharacterized protein n=1 Tax=Octopus bimaculoides TaxID=37653 RepID=A0A0L8IEG2_OCTBM